MGIFKYIALFLSPSCCVDFKRFFLHSVPTFNIWIPPSSNDCITLLRLTFSILFFPYKLKYYWIYLFFLTFSGRINTKRRWIIFDNISDFTIVTRPSIDILRLFPLFKLFSIACIIFSHFSRLSAAVPLLLKITRKFFIPSVFHKISPGVSWHSLSHQSHTAFVFVLFKAKPLIILFFCNILITFSTECASFKNSVLSLASCVRRNY